MATKNRMQSRLAPALAIGAGAIGISALAGLSFAMWIENGPEIFMTLVQSGLSCF